MSKTVAEKAQEKAIEKREEMAVAPAQSQGIAGIVGLEQDDLNMPYVYLVRANSKHALKADGKKASAGNYFHNVKKQEYSELEVIIAHAQKGKAPKSADDSTEVPVWRVLCVTTDNLYSPFVMSFKGMNHWYGWKPFVSLLMAEGVADIKSKVYKLTSKMASTSDGREYEVPVIDIVRDATEKEMANATSLRDRFAVAIESVGDEDVETINDQLDNVIQNEELDSLFESLD